MPRPKKIATTTISPLVTAVASASRKDLAQLRERIRTLEATLANYRIAETMLAQMFEPNKDKETEPASLKFPDPAPAEKAAAAPLKLCAQDAAPAAPPPSSAPAGKKPGQSPFRPAPGSRAEAVKHAAARSGKVARLLIDAGGTLNVATLQVLAVFTPADLASALSAQPWFDRDPKNDDLIRINAEGRKANA